MSKKKSFFERMGLVESSEEEDFDPKEVLQSLQQQSSQIEDYASEASEESKVIFASNEDFLTIGDIYEKSGLSSLDKSIFKVEEFSKHLPDNLPTETKRQSVIGILSASGLHLEDLLQDSADRLKALKDVSIITTEKTNETIDQKEQEIKDLLLQADILKQDIIDRKLLQEQQDSVITNELDKINKIVSFIDKH